jgi:hypothetical protein
MMTNEMKHNYPLVLFLILGCAYYAAVLYLSKPTVNEKTITELQIELTALNIKKLNGECDLK